MSFRINPNSPVFAPLNGVTGVSVDLSELSYHFSIQEFIGEPVNDWGVIAGVTYIATVTDLSLTESPTISHSSLTYELTPGGETPWAITVTVPITSTLITGTTYTWRIDVDFSYHVSAGFDPYEHSSSTVTFTTEGDPPPSTPTLEYPTNTLANVYLNKDWLLEMRYDDEDAEAYDDYTVYFSVDGGSNYVPRTDRSRYSILTYKMFLDVTLDYSTTYYWFVRKSTGGVDTDSDTWSFTTMNFAPPAHSTRIRLEYGEDPEDPEGSTIEVPSGENNQITVHRVVAAAKNKIFYEDV